MHSHTLKLLPVVFFPLPFAEKMPKTRRYQRVLILFLIAVLVVGVFFVLPTVVYLSAQSSDEHAHSAGTKHTSAVDLYQAVELEQLPLQIDASMMNTKADPCEDPVEYWCGGWMDQASESYRKNHPVSFSAAHRNAVGVITTIVEVERLRSWDSSPIARFHEGCTRTRLLPTTWGDQSPLFTSLIHDIRTWRWTPESMSRLFGRMAAVGADVPLSLSATPNPKDTVNGGWIALMTPAGIIGGGADFFRSPGSAAFRVRNSPAGAFADVHRRLRLVWRYTDRAGEMNALASDAIEVMRALANVFLVDAEQSQCWASDDAEASWANYFQRPGCFERDCVLKPDLDTREFNTSLFLAELNPTAWERLAKFWLPEGQRWPRHALSTTLVSETRWRNYMETSVRWAAMQQFASEWLYSDGGAAIQSPILRPGRTEWRTTSMGVTLRASRQKQWVPEVRRAAQHLTPIGRVATDANNVQYMSNEACIDLSFVHLQQIFEHYYIQALGLDQAKVRQEIATLVESGVRTLRRLVNEQTPSWTVATRKFFDDKLTGLVIAIGSPPYQRLANANFTRALYDDSFPEISAQPDSLVQNMFVVRRRRFHDAWQLATVPRAGNPVEDMPTYEINAFYDPTVNSITLLAGILQPPFYSLNVVDRELLYSRMLAVIGHELGHSMDPNGRITDWSGSILPADYWQQSTRALDRIAFRETEECLIEIYSDAVSRNGNHDDGRHTLGENLADTIGLRVGWDTLEASQTAPLTRESKKKFFGGWAQSWCARLTNAQELDRLKNDVHSLQEFRIAVPFSNMPEYAETFSCPADSKMATQRKCNFFH